MSYLLSYMMSGFNPFSVGGSPPPTPQDLQNMLGQGNIANNNYLDNINGSGFNINISSLNQDNHPFIWIYQDNGYISLVDFNNPYYENYKPYAIVNYLDGASFQTTIKGNGVSFSKNGNENLLTQDVDKNKFANQTIYLPPLSGQLQTQETPQQFINVSDYSVYYLSTIQNKSFYVQAELGNLVTDYATIFLLSSNIPEQLRIYIVFKDFGASGSFIELSSDLPMYSDDGYFTYRNNEALQFISYGGSIYIKKMSQPL